MTEHGSRKQTTWIVILAVALIIMTGLDYLNGSKRTELSNKLANANATISQMRSVNSIAKQQCIQQAQNVAAAAPTLATTAPNLSASIAACQARYPT